MNIKSIGIIMDGNRRFARERGLPTLEGHRKGYNKIKEAARWTSEIGIENLIVYALSTENWNRSKEEVSYLMDLFREMITVGVKEIKKDESRVFFAGDLRRFPGDIERRMRVENENFLKSPGKFSVVVAASYGGRAELVHAASELAKKGEKITEENIQKELWTNEIPDPNIIIRTGGEKRLSGFLTWQSVYSELFFVDTYWPAFSREEFDSILEEYEKRERRHGK